MNKEVRSNHKNKHNKQRALVLQSGGTLGAYEAGVLEILCKTLSEEDKENREGRLLFDIVAGASIGAMNGAVLVSNFLHTHDWEKAVEKLQRFWTNRLSVKHMDIKDISKPWSDKWNAKDPKAASPEAARRYYSVKNLLLNKIRNNMYYPLDPIPDLKFFDNNDWQVHSSEPLKESIKKYTKLPISTDYNDGQPRFLMTSVDVAEGVTVTFDSYPKADGSRKSEYKVTNNQKKKDLVITYNDGIGIEHIMASGTIPEFYKYAKIHINSTVNQKDQGSGNKFVKTNENKEVRYFTDGGVLNNTPFKELLNAHREYWKDVKKANEIPDLDVYVVNVHASRVDNVRLDHDGVKER